MLGDYQPSTSNQGLDCTSRTAFKGALLEWLHQLLDKFHAEQVSAAEAGQLPRKPLVVLAEGDRVFSLDTLLAVLAMGFNVIPVILTADPLSLAERRELRVKQDPTRTLPNQAWLTGQNSKICKVKDYTGHLGYPPVQVFPNNTFLQQQTSVDFLLTLLQHSLS